MQFKERKGKKKGRKIKEREKHNYTQVQWQCCKFVTRYSLHCKFQQIIKNLKHNVSIKKFNNK